MAESLKKLSHTVSLNDRKTLTDFLAFSTRGTADAKLTSEQLQASLALAQRQCFTKT